MPVEHAVQIGTDWLLVRLVGAKTRKSVPKEDQASELLPKVGKALNKPGIDRSTVFGEPGNPKVYAYSACVDQPGKIVRESVDGKKLLGQLLGVNSRPCLVESLHIDVRNAVETETLLKSHVQAFLAFMCNSWRL